MPLAEEEKEKIREEEKYRAEAKEEAEVEAKKKPLLKQNIGCGGSILIIIIIVIMIAIFSGGREEKTNPQEEARKNATNLYEQMIMDNAVTVIEKIPEYASSQRKICSHKDGFLIEDIYNAEWYVVGNKIFAVNGLAKSLTPDIDYAPTEISYQSCY